MAFRLCTMTAYDQSNIHQMQSKKPNRFTYSIGVTLIMMMMMMMMNLVFIPACPAIHAPSQHSLWISTLDPNFESRYIARYNQHHNGKICDLNLSDAGEIDGLLQRC